MSSTIAQARVGAPLLAPTSALRAAGVRTSLFQGCAYAEDPRDKRGYVFQLQAVRTGPGDVEDLRVHRFRYHAGMDEPRAQFPTELVYVDTMTVERGGHVQSCHVRISAAGNPYLWAGLEEYDRDGKFETRNLYRIRYRPDVGTVKTSRRASTVQRVYTGPGKVDAVGCPDWTIVLRRPGKDADVYEWHQERDLLARQKEYRTTKRPAPVLAIRFPHGRDDDYQSSLAQGKYSAVGKRRVYRLTGADRVQVVNSDTIASPADHTSSALRLLDVPDSEHVEPEGMFTLGGLLHVAVQTGSIAQRRVAYLPLSW